MFVMHIIREGDDIIECFDCLDSALRTAESYLRFGSKDKVKGPILWEAEGDGNGWTLGGQTQSQEGAFIFRKACRSAAIDYRRV